MGDQDALRVAELERKLRALEEQTAGQTAALRAELMQVQRVQALEEQLHEIEARHALETANLRRELERARGGTPGREVPPPRREARPDAPLPSFASPRAYPRLWSLALQYQIPTLIIAVCLLPAPFFLVIFAVPVAVVMLISALVSYALERRRAGRERPASPPKLARHQLCPLFLLQPVILVYAYVAGTFSLSGSHDLRIDDFFACLGIMEGGYLVAVALPLALVARAARRAGRM